MLNLYISHTKADGPHLKRLLEHLRPLQEKYYLRVWYDHPALQPVVPFPWNVLFFWYAPKKHTTPFHHDMSKELEQAHIYLFLTSHHSVNTPWIEQEEVPRAVERFQRLGNRYVRIFPISVSASQWRKTSRLANFPSLGPPGKAMNQIQPVEDGWNVLMEQLRPIIEEMRRNLMEENKRLGQPVSTFLQPPPAWEEKPPQIIPLPQWMGWGILALLLWAITNWYTQSCKPRYEPYWPKLDPKPIEAPRTMPVRPPEPVPVVPREQPSNIPDEVPLGTDPGSVTPKVQPTTPLPKTKVMPIDSASPKK
jgi:hypothetical protein